VESATSSPTITGIICPICKNSDQVRKASTVIDSSTTTTSGGMISAPLIGHGPVVVGGFSGVTRSDLSRRIVYFSKPTLDSAATSKIFGAVFGFGLLGIVVWIMGLILISKINPWLSLLLSPFTLIATCVLPPRRIYKREMAAILPSQIRWATNLELIRQANYCSRDDICFDADFYGKPEEYAIHIYETR